MRCSLRAIALSIGCLAAGLAPLAASALDRDDYETFVARLERQFGFQGEFVLRIMAAGVENYALARHVETRDQVSADDITCVFERPPGETRIHLVCRKWRDMEPDAITSTGGTSGDISAYGAGSGGQTRLSPGRDILVYQIHRRALEQYVGMLPGLPEMNRRLVAEGMATRSVPAGLPTREELDQFIGAYREVNTLGQHFDELIAAANHRERRGLVLESDAAMGRAILRSGLSEARYNEIVEFVSTQPELFAYVRATY
jgi:hypothetical protein